MGAASELLLFDLEHHRNVVLPAIETWLATGDIADWWRQAFVSRISAFDPDAKMSRELFDLRQKTIAGLPAPVAPIDEITQYGLEIALLESARDGLAFGNAKCILFEVEDQLESLAVKEEVDKDSEFWPLIRQLDQGLRFLNHGSGGFSEGLLGFLDNQACALLSAKMSMATAKSGAELKPQSVAQIHEQLRGWKANSEKIYRVVHSMADLAARSNLGLLHGRDLNTEKLGTWESGLFRNHLATSR